MQFLRTQESAGWPFGQIQYVPTSCFLPAAPLEDSSSEHLRKNAEK
jgi:hypothetical protein